GLTGVNDRLKVTSSTGNQYAKTKLLTTAHYEPAALFHPPFLMIKSTSQDNKKVGEGQAD
ncbi:MAG: hypothetical protein KGL32_00005, partial [candidate division NC10 bacterium]|nr:hypothetical protein [candidate division NC10 bacterium]